MKLSEFKKHLSTAKAVNFMQPNGAFVPRHFHITEVGLNTKYFIDCGSDIHSEKSANLQIWVADDFEHRLQPGSLLNIINISEKLLNIEDLEIEVEFQTDTIGKYGVDIAGENFILTAKQTDCLAKIKCNIPQPKQKMKQGELVTAGESCCTPGAGCC